MNELEEVRGRVIKFSTLVVELRALMRVLRNDGRTVDGGCHLLHAESDWLELVGLRQA